MTAAFPKGRIWVALCALGAALTFAAPAHAGTTPLGSTVIQYSDASRSTCEQPSYVNPYTGIDDSRTYVLAPGGAFADASAPSWQLAGGARVDGGSLVLPAGASAISPGMCVDLDYPHLRFAHQVVGAKASDMEIRVEVVYPQLAQPEWVEVKHFDGKKGDAVQSGRRISPDVDLKPQLGGKLWGARDVALRFTAVQKSKTPAEYHVDDVFIDPRMR